MDVPGIAWAQPNFIGELQFYFTPNDQFFSRQQGLHNDGHNGGVSGADVHCPEAWDVKKGNANLVIAIIDTGVDTSHPDLSIFRNDNEWGNGRENNGVDNDGNGYVDDYRGWDFNAGFAPWDNNPNPGTLTNAAAHGTSCAGIAGAIANNGVGIAGAAYSCKILPVKITDDDASTFATDESKAKAIRYAAQFADVISCSWGGIPWFTSSDIDSAIDYATTAGRNGKGCAVFFASGNGGGWKTRTPRVSQSECRRGHVQIRFLFRDSRNVSE